MPTNTADDGRDSAGTPNERTDRPPSTAGGPPTVTTRGDDNQGPLEKWGQRAVHVLLVIVPGALVLGIVLQGAGVHQGSMEFAAVFVGGALTVTGVLAVVVVVYETLKRSRQTELDEFRSFK